jgi:hypothetical protein
MAAALQAIIHKGADIKAACKIFNEMKAKK